jgi:hypothetical protein
VGDGYLLRDVIACGSQSTMIELVSLIELDFVMAGLVPAIHVLALSPQ